MEGGGKVSLGLKETVQETKFQNNLCLHLSLEVSVSCMLASGCYLYNIKLEMLIVFT